MSILLKKGANFDYKETHFGNTALIWAIANANNEMALEIIQKGRQDLDLQSMGNTALTLAIAKGYTTHSSDGKELKVSNLQLVQALLGKKADPNLKNPLQIAIIRRNPDMVRALLTAGARVDFEWKPLLEYSYQQASMFLGVRARVALLDQATFESSKAAVEQVLSTS